MESLSKRFRSMFCASFPNQPEWMEYRLAEMRKKKRLSKTNRKPFRETEIPKWSKRLSRIHINYISTKHWSNTRVESAYKIFLSTCAERNERLGKPQRVVWIAPNTCVEARSLYFNI